MTLLNGVKIRKTIQLYENKQSEQFPAQTAVWWEKVDSNHRSMTQQIYSLPPLATREFSHIKFSIDGAGGRTRTPDLLITNQLLYQLSYTSVSQVPI